MKISIAMATYNGVKFLQEQLDSFVAQTRLPDELIVCDDLSSDGTLELLSSFAQTAPFEVMVVSNEKNLGYTKNFEKALSLCTGDLIFFSDQDDVWLPEKIDVVTSIFRQHPEHQIVIHDGRLVDENLVWYGASKLGQVKTGWSNDDSFITGALTVVRREIVDYILPIPDGIIGHDRWIHGIGRLLARRLVVDIPLELIRRHSSNTSAWVASSVKKIDRRKVFFDSLRTAPASSYDDRIQFNHALIARIKIIRDKRPDIASSELLEKMLGDLEDEGMAITARNEMLSRGFITRRLAALIMLNRGQYKYFNGIKSFLRDMLR